MIIIYALIAIILCVALYMYLVEDTKIVQIKWPSKPDHNQVQELKEKIAPTTFSSNGTNENLEGFNFDKTLTNSIEATKSRRETIRQKMSNPALFQETIQFLTDRSYIKPSLNLADATISVSRFDLKDMLQVEEAQVFFEEFQRMCSAKEIKTELGLDGEVIRVHREAFIAYRDRIMGE